MLKNKNKNRKCLDKNNNNACWYGYSREISVRIRNIICLYSILIKVDI